MACFTQETNSRLAKRPLVFNGFIANHGSISLLKEAIVDVQVVIILIMSILNLLMTFKDCLLDPICIPFFFLTHVYLHKHNACT